MSFEPRVLECITAYRRKTRRNRAALLAPFVLAAAGALGLLLFTLLGRPYILRSFPAPSTVPDPGTAAMKLVAACLLVLVVGLFGYDLYASVRYAKGRFDLFLERRATAYDRTAAGKFADALEGAAIAAGVEQPALLVLEDPAANALGIEDPELGRSVGVTTGLLDAGIPVGEANAIIAHEVAHLLTGENVRPPGLADVEFVPSSLLVLFSTFSLVAVLVAPQRTAYLLITLGAAAAALVLLMLLYRSRAFITRMLGLAHRHDDVLADSLAVMMTRDPDALVSAIRRLTEVAERTGRVPGGTMLARYMFVTPPTAGGDYFRYASQVAGRMFTGRRTPRTWMLHKRTINEATRDLLEIERAAGKERLINLDLIRQGRWRALDDWRD